QGLTRSVRTCPTRRSSDLFPPDVRKAYDAWIAQRPFENPSADPHPFVPKLYEPRGTREAADATAKAATNQQKAGDAGSISGQYLDRKSTRLNSSHLGISYA